MSARTSFVAPLAFDEIDATACHSENRTARDVLHEIAGTKRRCVAASGIVHQHIEQARRRRPAMSEIFVSQKFDTAPCTFVPFAPNEIGAHAHNRHVPVVRSAEHSIIQHVLLLATGHSSPTGYSSRTCCGTCKCNCRQWAGCSARVQILQFANLGISNCRARYMFNSSVQLICLNSSRFPQ